MAVWGYDKVVALGSMMHEVISYTGRASDWRGRSLNADKIERVRCDELKRRDPAAYRARKEDTDHIFGDALEAVEELLLYCSPLSSTWLAPPHPYLDPARGEAPFSLILADRDDPGL